MQAPFDFLAYSHTKDEIVLLKQDKTGAAPLASIPWKKLILDFSAGAHAPMLSFLDSALGFISLCKIEETAWNGFRSVREKMLSKFHHPVQVRLGRMRQVGRDMWVVPLPPPLRDLQKLDLQLIVVESLPAIPRAPRKEQGKQLGMQEARRRRFMRAKETTEEEEELQVKATSPPARDDGGGRKRAATREVRKRQQGGEAEAEEKD